MPSADKKIDVIITEDDVFLRKILATKFEKEGFAVRTASNGEEALQKIREKPPALLLLDLILPKMNGFEVLTEMRNDSALKNIPVIILSNLGQEEDIERGEKLGVIGFLTKADNSINEIVTKVKEEYAKIGPRK